MNPLILTKTAKFMMIGSFSAYLSFAAKNNSSVKLFFFYLLGGAIAVFVLAALWEAREYLSASEPNEESLATLVSGLTNQTPKRQYYLSTQARLEIVIAFVVIITCAFIGGI
jgi:branched-subunit amino acid ABC-type transport system permease component